MPTYWSRAAGPKHLAPVLLRTPPPYVGYVIEESVLDRTLGGSEVLKEQLLHLLDCVRRMNHLDGPGDALRSAHARGVERADAADVHGGRAQSGLRGEPGRR
uniref:DUF5753 domain-containing protein n=1 Tax=Streptomyces sp. NBC_01401 TaxID=2903854 RepID=A0AAU3GY80_9ACTN